MNDGRHPKIYPLDSFLLKENRIELKNKENYNKNGSKSSYIF